MRLWTVQHENFITVLKRDGVIRADGRRADVDFRKVHYKWMMSQMAERGIGRGKKYPLWAWTHKPDMRKTGYRNPGTPLVRVELEVPATQALLSDWDAWGMVLNKGYVPVSMEDDDQHEAKEEALMEFYLNQGEGMWSRRDARYLTNRDLRAEVEASWPRVFDLEVMEKYFGDPRQGMSDHKQWVQACLEKVTLAQVVRADLYKAR